MIDVSSCSIIARQKIREGDPDGALDILFEVIKSPGINEEQKSIVQQAIDLCGFNSFAAAMFALENIH